jgi:DUF1680 family protein
MAIFGLIPLIALASPLTTPMEPNQSAPPTSVKLYPLRQVRLLPSPFTEAVEANRKYLLALEPERLLAPFRREAGLSAKAQPYGNWESMGLDGHTAGHYLSALATMIASGNDTEDGQLQMRLDAMVDGLAECQAASGDGYLGGVPGSKVLWQELRAGNVDAVWSKWVPWYNIHKTYAGLRDAYTLGNNKKALPILVRFSDWSVEILSHLDETQMQQMLGQEFGGMNEALADVYAITGETKYLDAAKRFEHRAILDPLLKREDKLTGLHANTQIPKIIGFERVAALTKDREKMSAADFFWTTVTQNRSVAFGGNSVSEHFNPPTDFSRVIEHREGPETCNTYNMLRLTEGLFSHNALPKYVDYYERALYNHILGSINPAHPGYVYFTPLRPGHYRVYSQPEAGFWCCVGTGMENPGRYAQMIYSKGDDGLYVNLFVPSELKDPERGLTLTQTTKFPDEAESTLALKLERPQQATLMLRHPEWVDEDGMRIAINGQAQTLRSKPGSYIPITREWKDGDRVVTQFPLKIRTERLPDGSNWIAIFRGPILLAAPTDQKEQTGLFAGPGRGDHIAYGPLRPLHEATALLANEADLPARISADPASGDDVYRMKGVAVPNVEGGVVLRPFFRLHETRYQMYWELVTEQSLAERKAQRAAEEQAKLERDRATIDSVAVGEQQPETDHEFRGEGVETGIFDGRRWRHGRWFEYRLNPKGEKAIDLSVTYSGTDRGRTFDILVDGVKIATQQLQGEQVGKFFEVRYPLPAEVLAGAKDGRITVRFAAERGLAGGVYDVRLLKRSQG